MSLSSTTGARFALTDAQLMVEVGVGSLDAFGELYHRYCDRAYRVALSVSRDHGRAEDAVQEAFLSIWNNRSSYRSQQGTVAAWLLTVVRHRAIDGVRHNGSYDTRRASDDQLQYLPAPDDVCETAIQRDEDDRLHASLAMLPEAQQEVITLAYYGQLSHTEIATHLGLPSGTVKGRMRLGLRKLRADIEWAEA